MTTITNAKKFQQYKSRFILIVEKILVFSSNTKLVRENRKICLHISNKLHIEFFVINNSHLDR